MRSETGAQFIKYIICGIITVAFYVGGVWLTVRFTAFSELRINSVFYALATALGYVLNYFWSFKSSGKHAATFAKYVSVAALGIATNFIAVMFMTDRCGLPVTLAAFIFAALWPLVSFAAQKFFVYRS